MGHNSQIGRLDELRNLPLVQIWDGIHGRLIGGERISLGIVELDPGSVVSEHRHEHEQLGFIISGSMRFTLDGETRDLGPGDTWSIPPNVPHDAIAGPKGAVVVDVFAPVREDWASLQPASVSLTATR